MGEQWEVRQRSICIIVTIKVIVAGGILTIGVTEAKARALHAEYAKDRTLPVAMDGTLLEAALRVTERPMCHAMFSLKPVEASWVLSIIVMRKRGN